MGKLLLRFHEKFSRFFDRNGSLFASLILTPFMDKWEWTGGWKLRYAYHHHNFFSTLRISWLWQGLSERSLLLTAFFFTWNWSELCIRRIGEARIGTFFVEWRWMVFDLISDKFTWNRYWTKNYMSQMFWENQSCKNYAAFKITISYICIAEKFVKSSRTMQFDVKFMQSNF